MSLIYLDNQATTPLDPRVWATMAPLYRAEFGNAGSVDTPRGRTAETRVADAREKLAAAIGAGEDEVIFTSGATEANNLALIGAMRLQLKKGRPVLITFETEHKCVLEAAKSLRGEGAEVHILPVQGDGLIDLALLAEHLNSRVGLVSAMAVHNEIGVIQNLAAMGEAAQAVGALFHCDMAQALGKIPIELRNLPIALASFSAHKAYGPQGVGALYVRRRPRAGLVPLLHGGGQERGLRSGTLPLALIAGFGDAAAYAADGLPAELERLWGFRAQVLARIAGSANVTLNAHPTQRIPGNLNLCVPGRSVEETREILSAFEFSRGSACTAAALAPSYVLSALGMADGPAARSFRLSFGRFTTQDEVDKLCNALGQLC